MPDPNTEHGLRVQLATALRERDTEKAIRWELEKERGEVNAALKAELVESEKYRAALQDIVTLCMDVADTPDWRKAVGDKARAALHGPPAWEQK